MDTTSCPKTGDIIRNFDKAHQIQKWPIPADQPHYARMFSGQINTKRYTDFKVEESNNTSSTLSVTWFG